MLKEDYVSFEIARLLKENGFNEDIDLWYDENGEMFSCHKYSINGDWRVKAQQEVYLCPTLQMAMKWLREVHHLFIGCGPRLSFTDFYWITANIYRVRKKSSLYHTEDVDDYHCVVSCDSHSYEDACESAIKYCLENLI